MSIKHKVACGTGLIAIALSLSAFSQSGNESVQFREGCCLNPSFPRPKKVSRTTIPDKVLIEALNCATSSRLVGDAATLARHFDTGRSLLVAYYYGKYMPEQAGPALTVGLYSRDGQSGMLMDITTEKNEYTVTNIPLTKRDSHGWKVGEVDGGLWTYTRLSYLAEEVGSRPRRSIALEAIEKQKPTECWVMFEKTH